IPAAAGHKPIAVTRRLASVDPVVLLLANVTVKGEELPAHPELPLMTLIVFEPLVIVNPCPAVVSAAGLKVTAELFPVPLVVSVNVLATAELVAVIDVEVVGGFEKVPMACAVVALVVSVKTLEFTEFVTVRDVPENGGLEKVPVSCAAVALVVSVSVLDGLVLWIVMLLPLVKVVKLVGASRLEKLPVLVALV